MGIGGIVVSALSYFLFCCPGIGLFFSLLGFGMTVGASIMAGIDLKKMSDRVMDPNGQGITIAALVIGILGALGGLTSVILSGTMTVAFLSGALEGATSTNRYRPVTTSSRPWD
jgi:hypothetical protein